ncbi:hypothetical protein EJF18_20836 [Clavispora lusitaniae]|uniref:Uncharacterized protein n=1 Tax=Clavispora lusitaniae TaxID=36911 RepID=A0ACD0WHW2_CLALS|nr:hypothetical protein EJF14_20836 [Clavispora lusitaniae]QFZ32583.1 hypothetical protein EJF16_20836 [Clavispora lusitaniae]QFZ38252.1 hypothetical protein EJF15_20836 [Clavispora lusitaniae]QFZ43935.1 hypothetical protein EJF18_20836 [Clavispora lusitaniae]QFZ49612.1 hypothetical protein EJF17_20836 [Clavispora lusitaniae]
MDQSRRAQRKEETWKPQSDLVVCFGAKVFSPFDDRSTRGTECASAGEVHIDPAPDAGESRDLNPPSLKSAAVGPRLRKPTDPRSSGETSSTKVVIFFFFGSLWSSPSPHGPKSRPP